MSLQARTDKDSAHGRLTTVDIIEAGAWLVRARPSVPCWQDANSRWQPSRMGRSRDRRCGYRPPLTATCRRIDRLADRSNNRRDRQPSRSRDAQCRRRRKRPSRSPDGALCEWWPRQDLPPFKARVRPCAYRRSPVMLPEGSASLKRAFIVSRGR